jgi:hypothetical protein
MDFGLKTSHFRQNINVDRHLAAWFKKHRFWVTQAQEFRPNWTKTGVQGVL